MSIRKRKPKDRPGFKWEYRAGCDCLNCPWKGNCMGGDRPHWIEQKDGSKTQKLSSPKSRIRLSGREVNRVLQIHCPDEPCLTSLGYFG